MACSNGCGTSCATNCTHSSSGGCGGSCDNSCGFSCEASCDNNCTAICSVSSVYGGNSEKSVLNFAYTGKAQSVTLEPGNMFLNVGEHREVIVLILVMVEKVAILQEL